MTWGAAEFLWGILFIIPCITLSWYFLYERKKTNLILGSEIGTRNWLYFFVLFFIATACVIISLAQPRDGFTPVSVPQEQRDIVVVLDVSRSMWATDVLPSRIDRAHWELRSLIQQLEGERIALVIFGKRAYARMPLSKEYDVFLNLLQDSRPENIRAQGSDLAQGIRVAESLFDDRGGAKSIVLLSDGEDHSKGLATVGDKLREKEIAVYVLSIGTKEGSALTDPSTGFLLKDGEDVVWSQRNDSAMKSIVKTTNGRFSVSQPGGEDWDILYEKGIKNQVSMKDIMQEDKIWNELFFLPLGLGVLFFACSYWVRSMKFVLLFLLCARPALANPILGDESKEKYALSLLQEGKFRTAETLLEELVLHSKSKSVRERSLYHASLAAYEQGKLVEALDYLHTIKNPTPQSKKNAVLIAKEIERRREAKPPKRTSEQSSKPNSKSGDDNQESRDGEQGTSESNSQQEGKEGEEREEKSSEDSNRGQSDPSSSNSENQQEESSEDNLKEETTKPMGDDTEESGASSGENDTGEATEQDVTSGNQENLEEMYTKLQEQSAARLIDSVKEGKNRGFANSEEGSFGSKAW